jgi:hypothetical protein
MSRKTRHLAAAAALYDAPQTTAVAGVGG